MSQVVSMPRRLTLVIHSLDGGGAEKTMALMANHWAESGYAVTLITLDSTNDDRYPLGGKVRRVGLDQMSVSTSKWQAIRRNMARVRQLRRAIIDASGDFVISFTEKMNVLTLIACRNTAERVIVCERTDPRVHRIGKVWSWLRRRMYRHSHAIVVQTNSIHKFVRQFAPHVMTYVVPNCVWQTSLVNELTPLTDRPKKIVAMGRLAPEKGFDLLIEAFGQIASRHPKWRLLIVGDGPKKLKLQSLIAERGLEERVELFGWSADPMSKFCEAQVSVMSSLYEGFPNALLEAMSCGVAAISFDCESGPREIIRHEVDGLLVPPNDVKALAKGLNRLLSNDDERCRLAERATEVRERFSKAKLFETWEQIFDA
jgi:glycosyltransferase involved in cell wall biosynthesis